MLPNQDILGDDPTVESTLVAATAGEESGALPEVENAPGQNTVEQEVAPPGIVGAEETSEDGVVENGVYGDDEESVGTRDSGIEDSGIEFCYDRSSESISGPQRDLSRDGNANSFYEYIDDILVHQLNNMSATMSLPGPAVESTLVAATAGEEIGALPEVENAPGQNTMEQEVAPPGIVDGEETSEDGVVENEVYRDSIEVTSNTGSPRRDLSRDGNASSFYEYIHEILVHQLNKMSATMSLRSPGFGEEFRLQHNPLKRSLSSDVYHHATKKLRVGETETSSSSDSDPDSDESL